MRNESIQSEKFSLILTLYPRSQPHSQLAFVFPMNNPGHLATITACHGLPFESPSKISDPGLWGHWIKA